MEEAISVLKKIGIKEIHKTTKISVAKIEDILEKRFSNLERVRVVGFLKILEREYKVDLSEWLEEYDKRFFADVQPQESVATTHSQQYVNNLDFDTQKQKDDLFEERKKQLLSKKRFYISLVVVVVILVGYFLFKNIFASVEQNPSDATSTQQEIAQIPQKDESIIAQEESDNIDQTQVFDSNSQPQPQQSQQPQEEPVVDNKADAKDVKSKEKKQDQIVVTPNKSLWIEIIDLDSGKKIETITTDIYPIEIDGDRLLMSFGHGDFSMQIDDEIVHYDKSYPMRFLYTPKDGLKRIKYSQYLELSGPFQ